MSHTLEVDCEYKDEKCLGDAATHLGGSVIGRGRHILSSTTEEGFGFRLKGWRLPLIMKGNGKLAFDDYNGHWGNIKDLETLKGEYMVQMTLKTCRQNGWTAQRLQNGDVKILHRQGTIVVTASGTIDAIGFQGASCKQPTEALAAALGKVTLSKVKPEMSVATIDATQVV